MGEAYINVRRFNRRILIDYWISREINGYRKAMGIVSPADNIDEAKKRLAEIVKYSREEEIHITRKLNHFFNTERTIYHRIGLQILEEIKDFLSNQRKDITFVLEP